MDFMNKRLTITLLVMLLPLSTTFASDKTFRYAKEDNLVELKNDTLTIENDLIKRCWLWNNGNLITRSLVDKGNNIIWNTSNELPDLYIPHESKTATEADIQCEEIAESARYTKQLQIFISYKLGKIEVKKVIKIYPNCPVIACEIYLKGKASHTWGNENNNPEELHNIVELTKHISAGNVPIMEQLSLEGRHWQIEADEFFDITDQFNTLVHPVRALSYRNCLYRGNLLFAENMEKNGGFFMLKEAPTSNIQLHYPKGDFLTNVGTFEMIGLGVDSADLKTDEWTRAYGYATGVYRSVEKEKLIALRNYQMHIRPFLKERDEMVMLNTWGDRGQDAHVNETFCLKELETAAKMGITHFQIDDGWQTGRSENSAYGGSFVNIWRNPNYWTPDPKRFPNGLAPIVKRGKELGIEICLWFNPSIQNDFADWEKDADVLISLYKKYGIRTFKIDGTAIPDKLAEIRLRKIYDRVMEATNWNAVLNLDATLGKRGGYFFFNEYGNIFLENRYTDWGNYYPYWTLRNIWMLSRYVPAQSLQIEFLNKWRNENKYANDFFAPGKYSFDYLFAITMAAQPLAWLESQNLPAEAFATGETIKKYETIQHDFHTGYILPIGDEPSGRSWCGFQSIRDERGYFIIYREDNQSNSYTMKTFLNEGELIGFTPVLGEGKAFRARVEEGGRVTFYLPQMNSYALYSYYIISKN